MQADLPVVRTNFSLACRKNEQDLLAARIYLKQRDDMGQSRSGNSYG